jgi:hypothetical protein
MNIEQQVCDLEYAKKLLTLGIKQNSLFYWYYATHDGINIDWKVLYGTFGLMPDRYSAFTASELLDILSHRITLKEKFPFNSFIVKIHKSFIVEDGCNINANPIPLTFTYIINYECDSTNEELNWCFNTMFKNIWDKSLANAAAKTLIHLIENGYMKNEYNMQIDRS